MLSGSEHLITTFAVAISMSEERDLYFLFRCHGRREEEFSLEDKCLPQDHIKGLLFVL